MMVLVVVMMTLRWGLRGYLRGRLIQMESRGRRRGLCLCHLAQGQEKLLEQSPKGI